LLPQLTAQEICEEQETEIEAHVDALPPISGVDQIVEYKNFLSSLKRSF